MPNLPQKQFWSVCKCICLSSSSSVQFIKCLSDAEGSHDICWQIHHSTKSLPAGVCCTVWSDILSNWWHLEARKTLTSGSSPKYCPDIRLTSQCFISQDNQGPDSISRWHLTSIGIAIADIKRSQDSFISSMEFPLLIRRHLCIESGSRLHYLMIMFSKWHELHYRMQIRDITKSMYLHGHIVSTTKTSKLRITVRL